ncbi:MAG TPA: tetratricopeptide repeat protein [Puia sp.]|nr:tetratricopeptide repeat protein [Puia sp.]
MLSTLSARPFGNVIVRSLRLLVAATLVLLLIHSRSAAQSGRADGGTGKGTAQSGGPKAAPPKDFLADSLKKALSLARTDREKAYELTELASYYTGLDKDLAEQYERQSIEVAELSRDRKLIVLTYLRSGSRYLNMPGLADQLQLSLENYQRAEKVARESGLDEELAYCYTGLSKVYRNKGEYDKSLNYNNLALSIASGSGNDSLKVVAFNSMGNTYRIKNEKLLAFRNYLEALNVAELSKKENLLPLVYLNLSEFYAGIEDYDKAIDYDMKILAINRKNNNYYDLLDNYNNVGRLFSAKKQITLALDMYENAIALADSLHFPNYKLSSYLNIANMYFYNNEMAKGMDYLNSHSQVLDFFIHAGIGFFIDEGYGSIYSEMGKYDSAMFFFKRAEPEIERKANQFGKYDFYRQFGDFYKRKGDNSNAIVYFLKARQISTRINDVSLLQTCAQNLDTVYGRAGDFKTAYYYNAEYNKYKDSIRVMSKETDLLKLEVDNDNKRRERLAREEEESTLRRHNIQYMGLTAGLAALFIALVMLGFFVVSPRIIRALGFFSFIFLFEFIILLLDKQIHELTHGEPWKVLLIKIFLAAILLPLHHWVEHKVIHYLTSRRKISTGISFLGRPLRTKQIVPAE